jgi:Domain of unknown function (DUF1841)
MFNPSQHDVRRFFCEAWRKDRERLALEPMQVLAAQWIAEHPAADYTVESGRTNPFLHLSMHLTISEQCSIDQPRGIRQAVELLAAKRGSLHDAHHEVMECLGEMVWASQRSGQPPDGLAYLQRIRQRATR